ncbi:RNA-binding domain-containing protein, partial [Tilletiopsis washingtonensis]
DPRTQLFISNLPYRVRWQDLKDLFRKAGTVLRADVALTPDNRSRGHGTVLLASEEDAHRAVDMFRGFSWQGRILEVRIDRSGTILLPSALHPTGVSPALYPFMGNANGRSASLSSAGRPSAYLGPPLPPGSTTLPPPNSYYGRVLFVGNLPFHCQWQDLKDLFRAAGNIQRADVALSPEGRSRGFGTVLFASAEDAQNAVRIYH